MKVFKLFFIFMLSIILTGQAASAEVVDRIVAVVNDDIITLSELNGAFDPYAKRIEKEYRGNDKEGIIRQSKEALLQQMVNQMLIEQEAKKAGAGIASIKDDEVMSVLGDICAKNRITLDEYVKRLADQGQTLESVKKEIKHQMLRMRLLRREVQSKILVTDEEIGRYYDKHRQDYEGKEAVRIKQILLPAGTGASNEQKEEAKALIGKLRERIRLGESFEMLAAQYSKGPAAAQGGDIGYVERGVIFPAVEKAAFSLKVGQLSDVIETDVGYHLILAVDKRGAGAKPIAAVRDEIKAKIEDEKLGKKYEEWIEDLRKKAFIEVRL